MPLDYENYLHLDFGADITQSSVTRLNAHLKQAKRHDEGACAKLHADQFDYYTSHWLPCVGEQSLLDSSDFENDLVLWYLTFDAMANFAMAAPAFRCYLFHNAKRNAGAHGAGAGKWVLDQVARLYRIMSVNLRAKGKFPMENFLNYDDVQGLFLSDWFIKNFADHKFPEPPPAAIATPKEFFEPENPAWAQYLAQCAAYKPYKEQAAPSLFSLRGWLTVVRNQYFIFAAHWLTLYVLICATLYVPLTNSLKGFAALAVVMVAFKLWLNLRARPEMPELRTNKLRPDYVPKKLAGVRAQSEDGSSTVTELLRRRHSDRRVPSQILRGSILWLAILAVKMIWSYRLFAGLSRPTFTLLHASWGNWPYAQFILVALLWLPFCLFYVLDTFAFFSIAQASIGYVLGKYAGIGVRVRSWKAVQRAGFFDQAERAYCNKLMPQSITDPVRQKIAWAKTWNLIVEKLYAEDRLTEAERLGLIYTGLATNGTDYLDPALTPQLPSDLSRAPRNAQAQERILFFLNSLFMKMPAAPAWKNIPSRTVITPIHNEDVIYAFEDLNVRLNSEQTVLAYLISRYPDEWSNLRHRLLHKRVINDVEEYRFAATEKENERIVNSTLNVSAADVLRAHSLTVAAGNEDLELEIRLWATYRFQGLARTVRGIDYHWQALEHLARLEFPTLDVDEIQRMVDEKLQYLVYMEYDQVPQDDTRRRAEGMRYLLKNYRHLAMVSVRKLDGSGPDPLPDGPGYYTLLQKCPCGFVLTCDRKIKLPDWPIDGVGGAKPERQNLAMRFTDGEKIQVIDMNQDDYFEEAIKMPNLLREFEADGIKLVGFPERIVTQDYGVPAAYVAFADQTFVTLGQRFLNWLGIRMHYGHPDVWDGTWAMTRGGVSKLSYLSEDIYGAYDVVLQGAGVQFVEYIRAGKAREVGVESSTSLYSKFGSGAGEQAISRFGYWLNTSRNFPLAKQLSHFYGALGVYISTPIVKVAMLCYLFTILTMGLSGYVSITPDMEAFFGAIGLVIAQSLLLAGLAEALLEGGLSRMLKLIVKMFLGLLPFFQFHILTNASGFERAMHSDNSTTPTGRGFLLDHKSTAQLYSIFRRTHIGWGFICLCIMTVGLNGQQGLPLIWSIPFVSATMAAIFVPFLFNKGGTPIDVGFTAWLKRFREDLGGPTVRQGFALVVYGWRGLAEEYWAIPRRYAALAKEPNEWACRAYRSDYSVLTGVLLPADPERIGFRQLWLTPLRATVDMVLHGMVIVPGLFLIGLYFRPARTTGSSWELFIAWFCNAIVAALVFCQLLTVYGFLYFYFAIVLCGGPIVYISGYWARQAKQNYLLRALREPS